MHRTAVLAAALAVAVLPITQALAEAPPPPVDETVAKRDATAAAKAWLALVDAGKYPESWEQGSSVFRGKITKDGWVSAISQRGSFGKLRERKFDSATYKIVDGRPTVVILWKGSYEAMPSLTEQVAMTLDDGKWRSSGYFVKPPG
jgi:hypothetical protein